MSLPHIFSNRSDLPPQLPKLEVEPQEEKDSQLPKSCFFKDGKSKVDYVLVYPKFDENIRGEDNQQQINLFLAALKEKGLQMEIETGSYYSTLMFVKIHAPHKVLMRFSKVYNIDLMCNNPYYKSKISTLSSCLTTPLTKPDSSISIYNRAPQTFLGQRPTEITTSERSLIVLRIIENVKFKFKGDQLRLGTLLHKEVFLHGYALHDGDNKWTEIGPLNDRQILFHFWANCKYFYKTQPIHLIEKYLGSKVAFYFALQAFYTRMLLVPALIGLVTVFAGFIILVSDLSHLNEEVCESKIILCSDQYLKTACSLMKLAYVFDNPVTIFYIIVCSGWGSLFWVLWQRKQAMLRLRWNLWEAKVDRTMRKEYMENASTRRSSITGEIEYYIPVYKKVLFYILSYTVVFIMVVVFVTFVFLIIQYRFILNEYLEYDAITNANELELFTSAILTVFMIYVLGSLTPLFLKYYAVIFRFLTKLRQPRTKSQYNRMYLHKIFTIKFLNFFIPLFYLAYFKGMFFTYPGNVSDWTIIRNVQLDDCKPSGCLVDLGMQLISLMIMKTVFKFSLIYVKHTVSPWHKIRLPKGPLVTHIGQWEKDFALGELDNSVINELYADLVMQYAFITFFNASLPVIGLIALIHNLIKRQIDAYRFLKYYRRPVMERTPDIEGWNDILKVVTIFGTISNAFVVAFRTDFVLRVLYRAEHNGTLDGFVASTLSEFALSDYKGKMIDHKKNVSSCFYRGFRRPPVDDKRYRPTKLYWRNLFVNVLYFIIIENFTLLLSLFLAFVIPEIPRKVKVKLEHDAKLLKEAKETKLEEQTK